MRLSALDQPPLPPEEVVCPALVWLLWRTTTVGDSVATDCFGVDIQEDIVLLLGRVFDCFARLDSADFVTDEESIETTGCFESSGLPLNCCCCSSSSTSMLRISTSSWLSTIFIRILFIYRVSALLDSCSVRTSSANSVQCNAGKSSAAQPMKHVRKGLLRLRFILTRHRFVFIVTGMTWRRFAELSC